MHIYLSLKHVVRVFVTGLQRLKKLTYRISYVVYIKLVTRLVSNVARFPAQSKQTPVALFAGKQG